MCVLHAWSLGFLQLSSKYHWFSNQLEKLIFLVLDLRAGLPNICSNIHSLGRISDHMITPSSSVSLARSMALDLIASPVFLLNSVWILLYSLDHRRVFLPISTLFSVRVALPVDVFLMYSLG